MKAHLVRWLAGNDTGLSSRARLAYMERDVSVAALDRFEMAYPRDPSDLGRCLRLMELEPSYRARIGEMANISPVWARLASHWYELEALYREEVPDHRGAAPRTYALMQEIIGDD